MANRKLVVYPDKDTMIQAGARRLVLALLDLLDERLPGGDVRGRVDVALSGGSAAQPLGLVAADPLAASIDWARVHFWFSDERFVPAYDTDRNALEARRLLLDRLVADGLLPESNIHEVPADTRSPEEIINQIDDGAANATLVNTAANVYANEMIREMGPEPAFDLMILGMGPDGHYASLFPASSGHSEVLVDDRLAVGVTRSPKMPPLRVSLTAPVIARSRRTWFFAAGAGKADSLAHVFAAGDGKPGDPEYPSSFAGGADEFVWFTTEETVAKL
ncbi:6-phosphogluconolactonase [Bifidobacterium aesculapii]|uniref:6-phosphogluconolactonase n=1 Tax=Bifidobacterium aesculapii TaxID=1329411 RepID=UPI0006E32354|nr:6-phosphogluconolactonase [Bifidobacterium aesculapii]